MKLSELNPVLCAWTESSRHRVDSLAQAHAIHFACPSCFLMNKGFEGTHVLFIPFKGAPNPNNEAQWNIIAGTGIDSLSLAPSILIYPVPVTERTLPEWRDKLCRGWHGFISSGQIITVP